ncbi:MAG: class I SAM-dependent methyltransferase [Salibacteraceae bacterium]
MNFIKSLLRKFWFTAKIVELHFLSKKFLTHRGWFYSLFYGQSIDGDKNPIPWFSYSSIHFFNLKLDPSKHEVFEFGSGNSTLWFSKRVKKIISVEHDQDYYTHMKPVLGKVENVEVLFGKLGGDYSSQILKFEKQFDVVVIDGRERIECAKNTLGALKDDGVVIWDNSDRLQYSEGYELFANNGFKRIDFAGMGPINHSEAQTTVFYRDNNCFGI